MEFNARYLLNGIFAVLVVLAGFGFVYWLNNAGGFSEKTSYQVRFTVPVSGLSTGSDVLFNGVKVGQVDGVYLDGDRPEDIIARISVARGTPIRTDTVAGIDYAGLTGAASILLTGGSAGSPPLAPQDGRVGEIIANPDASRSWTQKAGRILGVIDDVLQNNKNRFDAILSGLERLAGGGSSKEPQVTHDLLAATSFPPAQGEPDWKLAVGDPSVVLSLNTDRVLQRVGDAGTLPLDEARWADSLPNLFQTRLIQSFENAGYVGVFRPIDLPDPDASLSIDIHSFWLAPGDPSQAVIEVMVRIMDNSSNVVAVRRFEKRLDAAGIGEDDAVAALRAAFASVATEIVEWTAASLKQ